MKHLLFGPVLWALLLSIPALGLYGPRAAFLAVVFLLPVCFGVGLLVRFLSPRD